jgi:hypothetical protein
MADFVAKVSASEPGARALVFLRPLEVLEGFAHLH